MGVYPADLDVNDYAVAAIEVYSSLDTGYDLTIKLHEPRRHNDPRYQCRFQPFGATRCLPMTLESMAWET